MSSHLDGNFSQRLRALMNEQRIGQTRLAALSHISYRVITRYLGGRSEPRDWWGDPTPNAHKLARALGVEVHELLPPRDPNGGNPVDGKVRGSGKVRA